MNSTMNFYEILGVKNTATSEEIKSAYKKQMKKWHPDINKDPKAVEMSSKINEAKEILLDDIKRKDYDEYLSKKVEETYNRYTQTKRNNNNTNNTEKTNTNTKNEYEDKMMTKWEYLNNWLKYSTAKPFRKLLGVIGVLLESLLCWIIKSILITIAIICNLGSELLSQLFTYLLPVMGLLCVLALTQILSNGFNNFLSENQGTVKLISIFIVLFISRFLLPLFSKLVLSKKVFDILYNKIDINLFKFCVGYQE